MAPPTLPERISKTFAPPAVEGILEEARLSLERIIEICNDTSMGYEQKLALIFDVAENGGVKEDAVAES